jgi:hypothetical protein
MVMNDPKKRLEIKKGKMWELWLISPTMQTVLGVFNTLEELNQAQITLYQAWEQPRLSQDLVLTPIKQ